MKQSVLSRLLNDERPVYAEHVAQMLNAIPAEDREHCLRAFLIDQTPEQYRERLVVNFGTLEQAPDRRSHDPLAQDLEALEREAESNPDLRGVLGYLANLARVSLGVDTPKAVADVSLAIEALAPEPSVPKRAEEFGVGVLSSARPRARARSSKD